MPKVEYVNPSYSRKVQLSQFEPIEHFVELNVSLEEGDDPDEVYEEYSDLAEELVEDAIARRLTQKKLESSEDE